MNLLLIEDDAALGKALSLGLREAGHECLWIESGREGFEQAATRRFDAVVLDLMLPDLPGMDVMRKLRQDGVPTPVLMLTSRGGIDDRVSGLRAGADDYLVKPFAFPELLARLEAICRRATDATASVLSAGSLTLDVIERRVLRERKEINVTPTEFKLLEFLMRHAGRVVTRKMLCEHLWDSDWEGITNVVEVHINRLRGKVDRGFSEPLIQTIRGRGYLLRVT